MEETVFGILKDITGEDLRSMGEVNLFESDRLDSLGVIQFVLSLEERAGIHIDPSMVNSSDIETAGKMISYLQGVQGQRQGLLS
ncbi:MAG: phosphopantetheine-binding protein [Eubacteriales bacterium]